MNKFNYLVLLAILLSINAFATDYDDSAAEVDFYVTGNMVNQAMEQVNFLICWMNKTNPQNYVGAGSYLALVDQAKCKNQTGADATADRLALRRDRAPAGLYRAAHIGLNPDHACRVELRLHELPFNADRHWSDRGFVRHHAVPHVDDVRSELRRNGERRDRRRAVLHLLRGGSGLTWRRHAKLRPARARPLRNGSSTHADRPKHQAAHGRQLVDPAHVRVGHRPQARARRGEGIGS